MSIYSKLGAVAAALAAGAASIILAAGPASATTLTCTGIANQITPPLGCGGAQLAYTGKGALDLAVLGGNYWNSPVGFADRRPGLQPEDCRCSARRPVTDGPGGLGEYVAAVHPRRFRGSCGPTCWARGFDLTVGRSTAFGVENLNNGPRAPFAGTRCWQPVHGQVQVDNGPIRRPNKSVMRVARTSTGALSSSTPR